MANSQSSSDFFDRLKIASPKLFWPISILVLGSLMSIHLQNVYTGMICHLSNSYPCVSWASIGWNIVPLVLLLLLLGCAIFMTSLVIANSIELLVKNPREFKDPIHALIVPLSKIEKVGEGRGTGNHKFFGAVDREKIIKYFKDNSIKFADVIKEDYAIGENNPDELQKFKYFPWQQQFKLINEILSGKKLNALKSIHVLASEQSAAQRKDFKKMLDVLLKNQGAEFEANIDPQGVDYNDPTAVKNAMSSIINELKSQKSEEQANAEYIAIDITGGQRTFGAMAAILSTQKNVCFTYVADEGEKKYSVKFYNIDTSRLNFS